VDCGTNSIWFRVAPAGNWNGSGTANPATPLGGLSVSAIAANGMSPAGLFFASGDAVTANFGDSAFVGGVPSGFTSGFPAQVLAHATWNPSDKTSSVTLSGGSLTATLVNGTQGVRSTKAMTSGKAYFEISASTWAGAGSPPVGIANTTAALSSMSSSGSVGAATVIPAGNIYVNGSVTGVSIGARADGDVIGIAADLTNSLIWFRVAPAGNWNGNATYAPGVAGGVSFSAITGATICPVAAVQLSIQCVFTGNFGDSAFSGTVPSGYTAGWPPAPTVLNGPIVTMIG
jgi:hypothetical protein